MALYITDDLIVSDITAHNAQAYTADSWELSWLPGRRFTHDQAVTAMVTAEALHTEPRSRDPIWSHIESWMAELALDQAEWPWPDQVEQAAPRWS